MQKHGEVAQTQQVSEQECQGEEASERAQKPGEVFGSLEIHQGYPLEWVLETWTSPHH